MARKFGDLFETLFVTFCQEIRFFLQALKRDNGALVRVKAQNVMSKATQSSFSSKLIPRAYSG